MKICLECADGGHLEEMMSVLDAFESHDVFFVTFKRLTTTNLTKKNRVIFIKNFKGKIDPAKLPTILFWLYLFLYSISMIFPAFKIITKENPDVIFSTGGGISIPLCYIGKIMGIKIVYMESITRYDDLSLTGKFIYPISNIFLVQWDHIIERYKKSRYWGKII